MAYDGTNYRGNNSRTGSWKEYQQLLNSKGAFGMQRGGNSEQALQNAGRTILGGPVGAYEAVSGKPLFGGNDPWSGSTLNRNMTEEVYNSLSAEEWKQFAHLSHEDQITFIKNKQAEIQAYNNDPNRLAQIEAERKLKEEEANRKIQQDMLIKKVQDFAAQMNMPVDKLMQQDGFAQALNRQTYQNTAANSMSGGMGPGGYSQNVANDATTRALTAYQFQRQQAGQQALGSAFGMINQQNVMAEDIARYNQGMNLQMQQAQAAQQMQQYMQGLGQQQGFGGMIGGIIGGAYGGPTGAAMGQSIGSNMAGTRYQSSNPFNSYKYNYPSSTRPSGGMNNTRFGNS